MATVLGQVNLNGCNYQLAYDLISQNIANNTSKVKLYGILNVTNNYISWSSGTATVHTETGGIGTYYTKGSHTLIEREFNFGHDSNGNFNNYIGASLNTSFVSGNCGGTLNLPQIPRYATCNQTLNSKTETTITINWSSDKTIDYLWYSVDNGVNWNAVGSVNSTSGSYTISDLTPKTTYNVKTRVRRKDSQLTTNSTTLSIITEDAPSIFLKLKEETSIVVRWVSNHIIDKLMYSIDNGSTWIQQSTITGTTEICRISGLTPNTTYNIKLRLRRKDTQTNCDTPTLVETTYDYPHIESIGTKDLIIGNQQDIFIYNPLHRDIVLTMYQDEETRTELVNYNTNATNTTILPIDVLYESIPNSQSAKCVYGITYNNIEKIIDNDYTYRIKGTEVPTFTDFEYKDSNSTVTSVTGDNQILVKNLSNLQVVINSSNKMIPQKYAIPNSYTAVIDSLIGNVAYNDNNVTINVGKIISTTNNRLSVSAFDSRNLSTTVYKDVIVYNYEKPIINGTISRLNNFENETTLKISGSYTKLNIDNEDKNSILKVQYRYKDNDSEWTDWVDVSTTSSNGEFTCTDVILSMDNSKSFDFEIQAIDKFNEKDVKVLHIDIGKSIFFISTNQKSCYINGQEIIMYDNITEDRLKLQKNKCIDSSSISVDEKPLEKILKQTNTFSLEGKLTETAGAYYLLAKLPAKGGSDNYATLRINGYIGALVSGWKAVLDCVMATRSGINVNGTYFGSKFAFSYMHDIEIYEQSNGEFWVYFHVKSSNMGACHLTVEANNIISNDCETTPSTPYGTLVHTINDTTLTNQNITLNEIYPTGSIYMSVNNTNPSNFFGGTWEQIAKGRTLVGVDTSQTEFDTVKKTGGSKTHKHIGDTAFINYNGKSYVGITNTSGTKQERVDEFFGATVDVNGVSSGATVSQGCRYYTRENSTLQPYFTCYIWCRTA